MTDQTPHENISPAAAAAVFIASIVALVASLAGAAVALFALPQILAATLGFTVISAIAAVFGILAGFRRFTDGYGMATLCIGGTIAVAAGFAMLDMRPNLGTAPGIARLVVPWVGLQVVTAAVIVIGGAVAVLNRRPIAWRSIAKGFAFLLPAFLLLAGGFVAFSRMPETDTGRVLSLGLLLGGGAIVGILVSLGGHHLIRAFEITAETPDR